METKQMTGSNQILVIMAIVVVALVAVAAVFVAVRDPVTFDPDTPEGVTQAFLEAVFDSDPDAAHALLSDKLQNRCATEGLEERFYDRERSRVTLVESDIDGDKARIEVKFTVTYRGDPFDYDDWSYEETFRLERHNGEWRISQVPWPYYYCPEVGS